MVYRRGCQPVSVRVFVRACVRECVCVCGCMCVRLSVYLSMSVCLCNIMDSDSICSATSKSQNLKQIEVFLTT